MILCYARNAYINENQKRLREEYAPAVLNFRNVQFYEGEIEACDSVLVIGDYTNVVNAYENAEVEVKSVPEIQESTPVETPIKEAPEGKVKPPPVAKPAPKAPGGSGKPPPSKAA